jgi:hypothetical protein
MLIQDFNFPEKAEVVKHYPRGYCGVCKIGRPVYIERSGFIDADKVFNACKEEDLWKSFY